VYFVISSATKDIVHASTAMKQIITIPAENLIVSFITVHFVTVFGTLHLIISASSKRNNILVMAIILMNKHLVPIITN
jgi:hypothetical protein